MKIVISTDAGQVSEHFGRCPQFTIADIEDGKVTKKETIENPGHETGFLPKFFHELGAEIVIAGGAGARAQEFFNEYKIKLILGVTGSVDDAIEKYARSELNAGKSTCVPRTGKGYGIKKEDGHEE